MAPPERREARPAAEGSRENLEAGNNAAARVFVPGEAAARQPQRDAEGSVQTPN
jgi:hypothetical protein